MATLEIHDGRGRVEYVSISRENPALFGTDPKCDVVLTDPKVLPFHGRFRWKGERFKVEPMPEAEYLIVNGKKILSSSFRQGDELVIGKCRIFMLNPDDGVAETEKTRIHAKPETLGKLEGDWARELSIEDDGGAVAAPVEPSPPKLLLRRGFRGTPGETQEASGVAKPKPVPAGGFQAILAALKAGNAPPGEEKILTSPLVLGLVASLVLLGLLGYGLWGIIAKRAVDNQYRASMDLYDDGDFLSALKGFDSFLKAYPAEPRADKVRVLRALADVKQFTTGGGPVWTDAFDAARGMVKNVGQLEEYQDASADLGETVIKIAEGLADRARVSGDAKSLELARSAVTLHDKIAGAAALAARERTRLPSKLVDAEAAVAKTLTRTEAIAKMDAGIHAKSAAAVFAARDRLVARYPDLAADRAVVDRLMKGNELLRLAVTFDSSIRPAEAVAPPDPLGPATSLVLRRGPEPKPNAAPAVIYALAEGFAHGLDGATGKPLWQVPAGLSSPFTPIPVAGSEPSVLYVDSRHNELYRAEARTGAMIWRLDLEEPVDDAPLVLGNRIYQTTPSGKILQIDLATGELQGTLDTHRPLTRAAVNDESGRYLYVLADEASLFILQRDPLSCVGVEYLGHEHASIACAPLRLGRYLIVAENNSFKDGRLRVFLLDSEGPGVKEVQTISRPGWTWSQPTSLGSIVWATEDRGGLTAYSVGPYDAKVPLRVVASLAPDAESSGPAFARARTEREVWVSSGRTARRDLDAERGKMLTSWTFVTAGPALAPIQTAAGLAVLTHQATDGRGVALWGLNPGDGKVVWRTTLGAPWVSPPSSAETGGALTTIGRDGTPLTLTPDRLANGGFVESVIPEAGTIDIAPTDLPRFEINGLSIVLPSDHADYILVRESDQAARRVELPAPLAARPLVLDDALLIPATDGRMYLIDPGTGGAKADPYVPPFDRAKPTVWLSPVRIEGDAIAAADASGRIRRLALRRDPRPRLVATGEEADLAESITTDPASTGMALIVATQDGKIRALSGRDFSPLGAWPLEAPRAIGPVSVGSSVLVADRAGRQTCYGPEGTRLWSVSVPEGPPIGAPIARDGTYEFLTADGSLHRRSLADGSGLDRTPLDVLPVGAPMPIGDLLMIRCAPGTLRPLVTEKTP
jgi:outer membrane protein assembly factor BamB